MNRQPLYRNALPHLAGPMFLTEGGLETTLVFKESWDLPEFAAFVLLDSASGRATYRAYFEHYINIAKQHQVGLILDSATWRASPGWGLKLGYTGNEIIDINHQAVELLAEVRTANAEVPIVISGCIGPADDGYAPESILSVDEAYAYHLVQVKALAETCADFLCAITLTYVDEAIGIVRAAQSLDVPIAISFTVETDGLLPSGVSLGEAITAVDQATNNGPIYYMINCAHPTHFDDALRRGGKWIHRIGGIRANASCQSHAELDEATELDDGNPVELAAQYVLLRQHLPALKVIGGCCGTDHRHIAAIAEACLI